jgi:hypothetical protein
VQRSSFWPQASSLKARGKGRLKKSFTNARTCTFPQGLGLAWTSKTKLQLCFFSVFLIFDVSFQETPKNSNRLFVKSPRFVVELRPRAFGVWCVLGGFLMAMDLLSAALALAARLCAHVLALS